MAADECDAGRGGKHGHGGFGSKPVQAMRKRAWPAWGGAKNAQLQTRTRAFSQLLNQGTNRYIMPLCR
tara:strand:- start:262 stop:465 length:204 start_codon:yes stop_codon:yes gene_type:complete